DRALYFEALDAYLTRGWAPLRGIVQSGWKYIDLPEPELYDLSADPRETQNRITDETRRRTLSRALEPLEWPGDRTARPAPIDADAARRLRSLGYTGSAVPAPARATKADDPKRLVALNERFNSALTASDDGRQDEALPAFRAILA